MERDTPPLSVSFGEICFKPRFSDVVFVVGPTQERICGHRVILAARSEVFAAMLYGSMREAIGSEDVQVPDVPPDAFRNVLWFLYTGQSLVNTDTVLATLYAAKKYAVSGLAHSCILFLQYNLSPDNACQLLEQALLFEEAEFAGRCRRLILDSGAVSLASDAFVALPEQIVADIVGDSDLRLNELEVLRACVRWADAECRRRSLPPQQRRAVLAPVLLPRIRLAQLPPHCVPEVQAMGVLLPDEVAQLIRAAQESHFAAAVATLLPSYPADPRRSDVMSVYVVGGNDGCADLSAVEQYDTAAGVWHTLTPLPMPRSCAAAAVVDNAVYVCGGDDPAGAQLASCEWYDPHSRQWFAVASMASPRSGHACVALDNTLLALGGCGADGDLATVEQYDPRRNQWTPLPAMRRRRSGLAAVVVQGVVLAIGGYDGAHFLPGVERLDRSVPAWMPVAGMSHARADLAAAAVGSAVYALGGFDGNSYFSSAERYDAGADRWTAMAPMHQRRRFLAAAAVGECVYAIGGHDGSQCAATVERYDPRTDTWMPVPAMHTPRYALAAAVL